MIKQGLDYDNNVRLKKMQRLFVFCLYLATNCEMESSLINPCLVTHTSAFRVIMCDGGFLSCRGSRELTCTRLGLSAALRCHMLMCALVRPTPPPSSWRLNGADMLTRNRWVLEKREVDSMIVCICCDNCFQSHMASDEWWNEQKNIYCLSFKMLDLSMSLSLILYLSYS